MASSPARRKGSSKFKKGRKEAGAELSIEGGKGRSPCADPHCGTSGAIGQKGTLSSSWAGRR